MIDCDLEVYDKNKPFSPQLLLVIVFVTVSNSLTLGEPEVKEQKQEVGRKIEKCHSPYLIVMCLDLCAAGPIHIRSFLCSWD